MNSFDLLLFSLSLLVLLLFCPSFSTAQSPWTLSSDIGLLDIVLVDSVSQVTVADQAVFARCWNNTFFGPTLRVSPGDQVVIALINHLGVPTNLHFHGLRIAPLAPADDIFVHVDPGTPFVYQFTIPSDHPPGAFWYHSHAHGLSEWEVFNGMSGVLIIEGLLAPFPALKGITHQVLALRDLQMVNGSIPENQIIDSNAPTTRFVNGDTRANITMGRNEMQLWTLANIGADIFYNLTFVPSLPLNIISVDGQRTNQVVTVSFYVLGPGMRIEFLVVAPSSAANLTLVTQEMNTGPAGDDYPLTPLVRLTVSNSVATPLDLPDQSTFPAVVDLTTLQITATRQFLFADAGAAFSINNKAFDMDRVDVTIPLGAVEEWTIVNVAQEFHLFHIHQGDFQVTYINGVPVPFTGYQDSVILPINDQNWTTVTIIFPFDKPYLMGKFVFHCHILAHEDNGMMAVVEVTNSCPATATANDTWPLTPVGQTASGSCVAGLFGSPTRLCQPDGTWGPDEGTPCNGSSTENPTSDSYSLVQADFVAPYLVEMAEVMVTYTLFKILTDQESDPKDHPIKIKALNIGTAVGAVTGLVISTAVGLAVRFSGLDVDGNIVEAISAVSKGLTILFMMKLVWKVTRLVQGNPNNSLLLHFIQPLLDKMPDEWSLGLMMFLTALRDVLELGILNIIPQTLSDTPNAVYPSMGVGIASFILLTSFLMAINWVFNKMSHKAADEPIHPRVVVIIALGITALGAFMCQDLGSIIAGLANVDNENALVAPFGLLGGLIFLGRTLWYCWYKFVRTLPQPQRDTELKEQSQMQLQDGDAAAIV